MVERVQKLTDMRGGAMFLSVALIIFVSVMAIAAFSWAVDVFSGETKMPKIERFVAAENRDKAIVLADTDPRSHIPAELLDQLTAAR